METHAHLRAFCFMGSFMTEKTFKTIDEQIELLRSRGLIIDDEIKAKDFLLRNNYYRISGYSLTLRKNDVFSNNSTFQNIEDIYSFDLELRHIILRYLEVIEVNMKSIYAHEFTRLHGADGYLDSGFFTDEAKHKEIIEKSEQQKKQRLNYEAYLKHFVLDLKSDIPLWAYVDLFTFSDISFLYSISQEDVKEAVAHAFGLNMPKCTKILGRYMHSMTIIRNLCAHGNRIYNRLFEQKPSLNNSDKKLLRINHDGTIDNAHLYGFILIMRRILPSNDFIEMKDSIINLTKKYPFVSMRYYGFRDDWEEKL